MYVGRKLLIKHIPYVVASVLAAWTSPAVAEEQTCAALKMSKPTDADFERCLASHPLLTGGLVGSLTLGGEDGFRATLLGQVDVLKIPRVYLSGRARYGGKYSEFDLLAGFAVMSGYGAGPDTQISMSNTYHSPTAYGYSYTTTTTAHTRMAVQRNAWLLLGGVRGTYKDPDHLGEPMNKSFSGFDTYVFGVANHHASHDGGQVRIELLGYVNDGVFGFSAKWFNAIVGMEVGWVPVAQGPDGLGNPSKPFSMFYWNFVDVGFFKDLL